MIMPTTADLAIGNPSTDSPYRGANAGYHSRILKESETASPGYYSVYLYDHAVRAELTATTRCGVHRYTFPEGTEPSVLADLQRSNERVRGWEIRKVGDNTFAGWQRTGETISPVFFIAAKALSTALRSRPVSSATLPALSGSPALRMASRMTSLSSISVFL